MRKPKINADDVEDDEPQTLEDAFIKAFERCAANIHQTNPDDEGSVAAWFEQLANGLRDRKNQRQPIMDDASGADDDVDYLECEAERRLGPTVTSLPAKQRDFLVGVIRGEIQVTDECLAKTHPQLEQWYRDHVFCKALLRQYMMRCAYAPESQLLALHHDKASADDGDPAAMLRCISFLWRRFWASANNVMDSDFCRFIDE